MNELSQMFPKLDGDLRCVTTHFRFDHLVPASDGTSENPDSNELKTPLQNSKQFIVETALDDDDDEATLSTDYLALQHSSEGIVSTATKLLEDVINNSAPKRQQIEPLTDTTNLNLAPTINPHAHIKKQASLHNSESASSVTLCDTSQRTPRHNYEYSRFLSVDQRSISDTEDNVAIEFGSIKKRGNTKTQSCQTLSSLAPRSPGAILVKEKFIEFPKHVAQRTSSLGYESTENVKSMAASSESMSKLTKKRSSSRPRFTTTKIDESQLGASVLKEI